MYVPCNVYRFISIYIIHTHTHTYTSIQLYNHTYLHSYIDIHLYIMYEVTPN